METEKRYTKEAPKKEVQQKEKKIEKNIKGIKRIAGKDVSGDYEISKALSRIRGIGKNLSKLVAKVLARNLGIQKNVQIGDLSDDQIESINKILLNLEYCGIPEFMFNRRMDYSEGKNKHLIMNDLIFANKRDIDREKNIYTWKGYRHAYKQKVRGQRTRNTGRIGMTVGVLRKAILAQAKAAATTSAATPTKASASTSGTNPTDKK
ncbi:MAG: 30S ribosomal protein S13 [Candidatus Micrarchaeota archaeon]